MSPRRSVRDHASITRASAALAPPGIVRVALVVVVVGRSARSGSDFSPHAASAMAASAPRATVRAHLGSTRGIRRSILTAALIRLDIPGRLYEHVFDPVMNPVACALIPRLQLRSALGERRELLGRPVAL